MDPTQKFLYRKPLKRLKKFWLPDEAIETLTAGFMHGRGLFIQTNRRQVWAPLKLTARRVKSQANAPIQVMRKGDEAAIKAGAWLIQQVDPSRVGEFAVKPTRIPQPKRLFRRPSVAKPRATKVSRAPREENARKARARMLYDKGQISKAEYEWMTK